MSAASDAIFAELDRMIAETPTERLPALVTALTSKAGTAAVRMMAVSNNAGKHSVEPDENLQVEEAARRLGVSKDWLYKNARRLPFSVRIGRRLLFSARGLERWNQQRQGR